jgi:hypothetical protein
MSEIITTKANMPAIYSGADDDFKDMRQRDMIMPNLRLMQALSPLVTEDAAKSGDFADVSTKTVIIPKESKKFVVPLIFWLEWIEWNPNRKAAKDQRILNRSNDPSSELAKVAERWETIKVDGKDRARVTEYYNFIVAMANEMDGFTDFSQLYVLNFSKTGHRTGKMWLNKLKNSKIRFEDGVVKAPIWYNQWELYSILETKDTDKFYTPQIGSSKATPVIAHDELKATCDMLKERRAEIMSKNTNESDDTHTATPPETPLNNNGPAKSAADRVAPKADNEPPF